MRILVANKFFYDHGGPESVLFAQRDALQAAGHTIVDFSMQDPRNHSSPYASYFAPHTDLKSVRPTPSSVRTAWRFLDSKPAADNMRRLLRDHRPDVAHLHSINHQLTPSILRVLREELVPVVMTLHDYKLVCPAYTLLSNGSICENCAGGRFYRAATTNCRGPARSPLLAAESYLQHRARRSYDGVELFLSPSRFLADKFREMGFRHRIEVLPNPASPPVFSGVAARQKHLLFVGRIVPEKGLRTLCAAALRSGVRMKIAGDGPQLTELRIDFGRHPNIEFVGRVDPPTAQRMMAEATAVLVPSEWYENQPMVILEAFAQGTPVIATDLGGNPELVREGETGLLHAAGDVAGMAERMKYALAHPDEMVTLGAHAREFAKQFSLATHIHGLERILASVIDAHAKRTSSSG